MIRIYTDIWNNFQIRQPIYLDGHFNPNEFDIIKWYDHEPYEVIDAYTGEKKKSTRSCFSIATLKWDTKNHSFDFKSCGLRYLEHRIDGLEDFILDFCKTIEQEREDKE